MVCSRIEALPGHRHLRADLGAWVEVQHITIVHANAALRGFRADRPGCIRAMDAVGAGAEVKRSHTQGIHGMPARHPRWQPRILSKHGWSWTPRWIDFLVGDARHALPAVLLAGNGDRVADRLARTADEIQTTISEADDDFAWSKLGTEADDLAPAGVALISAAPIPKNLGYRRTREADR